MDHVKNKVKAVFVLSPNDAQLQGNIKAGEGFRLRAYADPKSPLAVQLAKPLAERVTGWAALPGAPWTCGWGCTKGVTRDTVWTSDQAQAALNEAIGDAFSLLDHYAPWWRSTSPQRQRAMAELVFEMGWGDGRHGLSSFHKFLAAAQAGDWMEAGAQLQDSGWYNDVHATRGNRIVAMVENG